MDPVKRESRRKLLAVFGALSIFSLLKLPLLRMGRRTIACGPPSKKEAQTQRLLSQDGQLVEVDPSRISVIKQKIGNEELRQWVHRSA